MSIRIFGVVAVAAILAACDQILPVSEKPAPATETVAEVLAPAKPLEVAAVPIEACEIASCHALGDFSGFEMMQAGVKEGGSIVTNGTEGYLIFGPYMAFEPGTYRLVLNGTAAEPAGAKIDVVGDIGAVTFADVPLPHHTGNLVDTTVSIPEAIGDLEVRVFVTAASNVKIDSMSLRPAQ